MQEVDEKNRAKAQSTGRYLDEEELHLLIAQRAYDLVCTSLDTPGIVFSTGSYRMQFGERRPEFIYDTDEIMKYIPDLTKWPKTASQSSAPDE